MGIVESLIQIQAELKAPKDQNAGRYRYRNIEDINEAVKPIAKKHGCVVTYSDTFKDGVCISECRLTNTENEYRFAIGNALINTAPKNMSVEQASGSASSYARKYAACGLFAIDDSELDPDTITAEQELRKAQARIQAVVKQWATREQMEVGKWYAEKVKVRSDYANDTETLNRIAKELEEGLKQ